MYSSVRIAEIFSDTADEMNWLIDTPSCFATYMMNKVLKWVEKEGGLGAIEKRNAKKAELLYGVIDKDPGFFKSRVEKECRSFMNVTFNLKTPELEEKCIKEAVEIGLIGLKGHRSVGGMRASIYNAMPVEGVKTLVVFLKEFQEKNE